LGGSKTRPHTGIVGHGLDFQAGFFIFVIIFY